VIFRELHALRGQGKFVFPAVDSVRRCMSNSTLNAAPVGLATPTRRLASDTACFCSKPATADAALIERLPQVRDQHNTVQ
jgi:hypothetical protein